jgi:arsenite-transporting ATPase
VTRSPSRGPTSPAEAAQLHELVDVLTRKFTFFVGKGGVGKSTSAAAFALRLADNGERIRLISTDPAHSLGDAFGVSLSTGVPTTSPCTPRLTLEEIDAPGRARAWLESVRDPIAELIDRGTYLDRADVAALLDRSMPGMDELMGALRLVELARAEGERVVVDTAPTGHLLRMLDAGRVIDGWSQALAAMAAKAGAVATGLTGRRVSFAGEEVIARLRAQVEDLRTRVLGSADFVIVTRAGDVVAAETARLEDELDARGCRVSALVGVDLEMSAHAPTRARTKLSVPWRRETTGCQALRAWGEADPVPSFPPRPAAPRGGRPVLERLAGRDLYLFVGKGGVGKSTCAAAFALAMGTERDVLLLGTDPAGSLGDVLGLPVGPSETPCGPRVAARELDAEAELEAFRCRYRDRIRSVFERLGLRDSAPLDRRVLESVVDLAPSGIDEIFALDAIIEEVAGVRALVVDAAPTGHLLRLLEMPQLARSWSRAVLKVLLQYRSVLGLDDFAGQLLGFVRRVEELVRLLRDAERVATVIVTLNERLPLLETDRLARSLASMRVPVAATVRNRCVPGAAPPGAPNDPGAAPTIFAPLVDPPPVGPDRLGEFFDRWSLA